MRAVLLFLGIAGVAVYFFYPNEQKQACLEKNAESLYPYISSEEDVAFLKTEPFAFECILSKESGNCGFGISLSEPSFENWNLMDSIIFNLQSSESFKELIAQILTFGTDQTNLDDRSTMKPLIKEVELSPNKTRYSIPMQHFYTPDYWFKQQKTKIATNPKKFSAVISMELYSGWKNEINKPLNLKIESICLKGANNTPFVVLVIYLAILIAIAISARTKKRN